jgi:hypothetical protein
MTTTTVYTNDTVTFQAAFKDPNGVLVDPDGQISTFTVFKDDTAAQVATSTMTRQSQGVYTYDWLIPAADGVVYIIELKGLFSTKPQLQRTKVRAKFRP